MSETLRVVVIDDEFDIAHVLALAAVADGHAAVATSDPARVLSECHNGVDAVVLDLAMPGIDGIALLQTIAATRRLPRVVLMSAYDHSALSAARRLAERLGFEVSDTLQKPFGIEAFRAAVRRRAGVARAATDASLSR